jgi:flavin reductase (DIM6/NTAB) family NADH-FMN oxidoreductase RutF
MKYVEVPDDNWYRLINHGPTVMVSTRDKNGIYNIAPIAWCSPVQKNPPKLLTVIGRSHKTYTNIMETGEFVVCVPHINQAKLVRQTGKSTGDDIRKFDEFAIKAFSANEVDILIPEGCVGFIECRVSNRSQQEKVDIIVGEVLSASALESVFEERLLAEKPEAKTLHHLGGSMFAFPADGLLNFDE